MLQGKSERCKPNMFDDNGEWRDGVESWRTASGNRMSAGLFAGLRTGPIAWLLLTLVLWRGIDANTIDAAVNDSAAVARNLSDGVRRMQSGNIRSYAAWVAAGAAAVLVYMVWMGVR